MSSTSNAVTPSTKETSYSSCNNQPLHCHRHPRRDNGVSASRFKGVVCQQNGHWGAQIYANRHRIWLGTFKSEREAAMAYDSAATKLRIGDSHRNFSWTNATFQEPYFQSHFSTEAVLNMIKDGSYPSRFADFLRMQFQRAGNDASLNLMPKHGNGGLMCTQLFQKELTPSDVGKLNRLVIPKKYALRYFPDISKDAKENLADFAVEDVQLVFYDRLMRSWKFRYCYWKSSQSFVFTRGWNRFVKENGLKEKDIIRFSVCKCREGPNQMQTYLMVDVVYNDRVDSNASVIEDLNEDTGMQGQLQQFEEQNNDAEHEQDYEKEMTRFHLGQNVGCVDGEKQQEMAVESTGGQKGLRIFGVQIL
ncbi:AP2/ERF and B3 domain-containing transcription factor At1g50680-like [Diospyros lotus]|uniref:AP2/ERF and B3 domain-containing transcription factor At1g50680-like n=1 Tax=Diospyros lotus TaxID=55363 RepID=UPI00225BADE3|nr:AP2/ERF and B3 domain-containing transcription factor At1g50680-like [Diospyros lotus]XP_052189440.1 AP2/ERF and B3 domain-containing transcription factor At1g50680-like [Diospyros lotus]